MVVWSKFDDCSSAFFSVCLVQTCLCRSPDLNGGQLHGSFVACWLWFFCWWQCNNFFYCERTGWEWLLGKGCILDMLLRTCSLWVFRTHVGCCIVWRKEADPSGMIKPSVRSSVQAFYICSSNELPAVEIIGGDACCCCWNCRQGWISCWQPQVLRQTLKRAITGNCSWAMFRWARKGSWANPITTPAAQSIHGLLPASSDWRIYFSGSDYWFGAMAASRCRKYS